MDLDTAGAFLADRHQGVLVTLKHDGRPQSSNIVYAFSGGAARVSLTDSRAKTKNLRRDPRASLHVSSADFWQYCVLEGTAELSALARQPGDATCLALRRLFQDVQGREHPDWAEFDAAMVGESRLVLTLVAEHAYGQVGG